MTEFLLGVVLGMAFGISRDKKPILRFPLRCWFLGHTKPVNAPSDWVCTHCNFYSYHRFDNTFWTI